MEMIDSTGQPAKIFCFTGVREIQHLGRFCRKTVLQALGLYLYDQGGLDLLNTQVMFHDFPSTCKEIEANCFRIRKKSGVWFYMD